MRTRFSWPTKETDETNPADYLEQLTPDNAAVLFIDNQTTLTLGVQSIDLTVLKTNTEGLGKLSPNE